MKFQFRPGLLAFAFCVFLLTAGCINQQISVPSGTAAEQLLLSTAADRALERLDLSSLRGRKIFLDARYFEPSQPEYVLGSLRDLLSSRGALLMADTNRADMIVEARTAALGIDSSKNFIGLPSVPVPLLLPAGMQTPELAIFKAERANSIAKIALFAYDKTSREHLFSSGGKVGRAKLNDYRFLGIIKIRRTDIPEEKSGARKREERSQPAPR